MTVDLQGCAETDRHTNEAPVVEQAAASSTPKAHPSKTESDTGKETYSSGISIPKPQVPSTAISSAPAVNLPPPAVVEEEDDLNVPVKPGTTCKRKGCGVTFVSDEVNRNGDGEGTKCVYHPAPVILLLV